MRRTISKQNHWWLQARPEVVQLLSAEDIRTDFRVDKDYYKSYRDCKSIFITLDEMMLSLQKTKSIKARNKKLVLINLKFSELSDLLIMHKLKF